MRVSRWVVSLAGAVVVCLALLVGWSSARTAEPAQPRAASATIKVGLITKTETNPFFVKMKQGAQQKARQLGVQLLTAAGKFDGDNASQVTAIENMVAAGVKGILITPSNTTDRKSTRLNSSHRTISYAVFCLKKKTKKK